MNETAVPTPATAHWPRPRSEDEWEDIVLDALKLRWEDPDAQRNGRRGQRQDGVDIYGRPSRLSGRAGAQCKNTTEPTLNQLEIEVAKAEGFVPQLAKFYFVVAASRDSELQEQVRLLSDRRISTGKFPVDILFFEEVCNDLSSRPDLVAKYWHGWERPMQVGNTGAMPSVTPQPPRNIDALWCMYLGGDPRLDARFSGNISVDPGGVTLRDNDHHHYWPSDSVRSVSYHEQRLGMEQAEYEEGVLLDVGECLVRHTAVFVVRDPEELVSGGFRLCFRFAAEYFARLFVKRCRETIAGLATASAQGNENDELPF